VAIPLAPEFAPTPAALVDGDQLLIVATFAQFKPEHRPEK